MTTVDHKRIGIMYGASALFFFVLGGIEAVLIRLQLAAPGQKLYSADLYNQLFTMHGVTMIFLVVIPLGVPFMNYLMPLQIGARDVAFPRLNALSLVLPRRRHHAQHVVVPGGRRRRRLVRLRPNTGVTSSPSHGMDFYAIGLQITGIASLVGAINLVVTVLNAGARHDADEDAGLHVDVVRDPAPACSALPVISVALFLLTFDRLFDANFFNVPGADPLLWSTCSGSSGTPRSTS